MSNQDTQARALRAQALALLQQAEAIDNLKPFLVTHEHGYGESHYLLWARELPEEHEAEKVLDSEFEPDRGEFLRVSDDLSLEELAGVGVSARLDDLCAAELATAKKIDAASAAFGPRG